MKLVTCESHEHAILLRLNNGPTNALNGDLITQLSQALGEVEQQQSYRFKGGEWRSFRCGCGKTVQLSPNFSANRIRCRGCGRWTEIVKG